jgi:hypothetical protein
VGIVMGQRRREWAEQWGDDGTRDGQWGSDGTEEEELGRGRGDGMDE